MTHEPVRPTGHPAEPHAHLDGPSETSEIYKGEIDKETIARWGVDEIRKYAGMPLELRRSLSNELLHASYYVRWDRIKELSLAPGQTRTESIEITTGIDKSVTEELRLQSGWTEGLSAAPITFSHHDESGQMRNERFTITEKQTKSFTDSWSNASAIQVLEISIWQRYDIIKFSEHTLMPKAWGFSYRIEILADSFRTKSRLVDN